jgi:hypothetical protein
MQNNASLNGVLAFDNKTYSGTPYYDKDTSTIIGKVQSIPNNGPVTITVTGVLKDTHTPEYVAKCQKTIIINPAPPPPQSCSSLTINPTGPFDENGLPQTINVTATAINMLLDFKWTATQNGAPLNGVIAFDNNTYNGQPYYDTNASTSISKIQSIPNNGPVTITVTGVKKDTHTPEYVAQCQQSITINPTPPPQECKSLQIYQNNQAVADTVALDVNDPNQFHNLSLVEDKDAGLDLDYVWQATTGTNTLTGSFDNSSNPKTKIYANDPLTNYNDPSKTEATTVTVKSFIHGTNTFVTQCQDQFVITPPPPPSQECRSLTIYQGNYSLPGNQPYPDSVTLDPNNTIQFHNLFLKVDKDEGLNLDYFWTANTPDNNLAGIFDSKSNPLTKLYENDPPTNYDNPSTTLATTVTVKSFIQGSTPPVFIQNCQDQFVINPPPQQVRCTALNFKAGGQPVPQNVTINEGQTVLLEANPAPNPPFGVVKYEETGNGYFTLNPYTNPSCANYMPANVNNPYANTTIIAPSSCSYNYTGAVGGNVNVSAYAPGYDTTSCIANLYVQQPPQQPQYCDHLTLTPTTLENDGSTFLNATVYFSDGKTRDTTVQWSGNGTFQNGTNNFNQTSSNNFFNTFFNATDAYSSSVHVQVTSAAGISDISRCYADAYPPPKKCTYFNLEKNGNEWCVDTDYSGPFIWEYNGNTYTDDECRNIGSLPPNSYVHVYAKNTSNCEDSFTTPEKPQPPELEKYVNKSSITDPYQQSTLTIQPKQEYVYYEIIFNPQSPKTSATITDTISDKGSLTATLLPENASKKPAAGKLNYSDDLQVIEDSHGALQECNAANKQASWAHCYTGNIENSSGIRLYRVDNSVKIRYRTKVSSSLTANVCSNNDICQEKYDNRAQADSIFVDIDDLAIPMPGPIFSNPITVQIFCQYILTRAAGDIFMETDLTSGIDILRCGPYKTTTGLIITNYETPEVKIPSTGTSTIFTIEHEICQQGQTNALSDDLAKFYGADAVSKLSSQICEVKLQTGKAWQQQTITNSVEENKTRMSRWEPDAINNTAIENIQTELKDPDKNVYHIKDANLTINNDFTLNDGDGAKTIIVENGDLIINGNIIYGPCNKADGTQCNLRDIASLAFIVLNGNIYVDPGVSTMSGVFYVQEGVAGTGKLISGSKQNPDQEAPGKLTVYGSIYGDIDPLFTQRSFAGAPEEEESGILIRFDQRVILNTPPGLRDVLNLTETEVAR